MTPLSIINLRLCMETHSIYTKYIWQTLAVFLQDGGI